MAELQHQPGAEGDAHGSIRISIAEMLPRVPTKADFVHLFEVAKIDSADAYDQLLSFAFDENYPHHAIALQAAAESGSQAAKRFLESRSPPTPQDELMKRQRAAQKAFSKVI